MPALPNKAGEGSGGHPSERVEEEEGLKFFGFSSSTWRREWSGIMEPGRQNGRETGLRFQPDRG